MDCDRVWAKSIKHLGGMTIVCPGCKCRTAGYELDRKSRLYCSACKGRCWLVPFDDLKIVDEVDPRKVRPKGYRAKVLFNQEVLGTKE